jgi:hypothetical protein
LITSLIISLVPNHLLDLDLPQRGALRAWAEDTRVLLVQRAPRFLRASEVIRLATSAVVTTHSGTCFAAAGTFEALRTMELRSDA